MNKQEYLETLESLLKHKLSREDIEDIMRDYAEYFEEGRRQSKPDSEIAAKLGNPEIVAQELMEENIQEEKETHTEKKIPNVKNWWDKNVVSLFAKKDTEETVPEHTEPEEDRETGSEPKKKDKGVLIEFWNERQAYKENQKKSPNKTNTEGLFLKSVHAFWRGVRWCIYLVFASVLMMTMAGLSAGVLGAVAFAAVILGFVFLSAVLMSLVSLAGIVLSSVGFAFYQHLGLFILFASITLLGLSVLLVLLCIKLFQLGIGWTKELLLWGGRLWMRIFHKVESWLIIEEKTFAPQQEEKVESPAQTDLPKMCRMETAEEGR